MKQYLSIIILITLCCTFVSIMAYIRYNPPIQNKTSVLSAQYIKIGAILPLSGDAAAGGLPLKQAAELAVLQINQTGGIKKLPVQLNFEDGRCEKKSAQEAADKLLNTTHVNFLIGGACSDEFLISAPIAKSKNILSFTASATSPQISQLGKNIFRTAPSDALSGKVAAQYARTKLKGKTAVIIAEDKDFTNALKDIFTAEFNKQDGKILKQYSFKTGTNDFATIAKEIKSLNPDIIYLIPQTPSPGILAIKSLKELNVPAKIITGEILLLRDNIAEQGKVLEGITGVEVYFDENNPRTKKFLSIYKQKYGTSPSYPAYMTGMYDIFYLIKEAYENTDGSTEKMAQYLYSLKQWPGTVGELSFDQNGDPLLSYSIRKIVDKQATLVEVYKPE